MSGMSEVNPAPGTGAEERTSVHPADRCVHRLFEARAAAAPDAAALVLDDGSIGYRALDERAGVLAHRLRERGIGPEARVGICLERGADAVAAMLATLKAGAAFVPLDPAYPAERLAYMLADAGVRTLVTRRGLVSALPPHDAGLLLLDDAAEPHAHPTELPSIDPGPDALAYVIYTSGSTGRPKGVGVTHRGLHNTALSFGRMLGVESGSRFLQFASPGFDASVCEVFVALAAGAELHLAPREALLPGPGLVRLLDGRGITHAIIPPSALAVLPEAELPALATLIVAGEACAPELVRRWSRPGRRFVNAYGPTEVAICATAADCEPDGRTPPIGPPIDGAAAHVLDASLAPAAEGELYVGGEGVARGYLGRPGLTAERFVPDPFSSAPGARMYRTGDRVRVRECVSASVRECVSASVEDSQGAAHEQRSQPPFTHALTHSRTNALEFVGRMDDQVKVRGHRVEPGEVADALAAHPALAHAAVVARADGPGGARLVAYVVPRADIGVPAAGELRAFLARTLPEHMLPSAFVALDALPLTPNGKVDRGALPAPPATRPALAAAYVPPRTDAERRVAAAWGAVLGIEGIGAEDGFLELGGHSLAATRVVARLREAHGVEVPLEVVLSGGTVARVAAAMEEAAGRASAFAPITPVARGGDLPPSFSQERVWFLAQLAPDNLSYHAHGALVFRGALDAAALESALSAVVARHEIFRTTFPTVDGRPVQRVHAPWTVRLPRVDFSGVPAEAREEAVQGWMREEFTRRFDLSALPLVRWTLLRLAGDEHRLVVVEHHVVHDGWSFNVFLRELLALYGALAAGRPSPLPAPALQFGDYAWYQRRWLQGEEARRQLDFWRGRLAGSTTVLELAFDRPRPAEQRLRGAAPRYELPAELYRRLRAVSHQAGVTPFATMMAAFDVLLWRWSGQADLNVGTAIANRRQGETHGLIGMFVNTVVVRARLDDDPAFDALARRVHGELVAVAENQELPFETVVEALRPPRSPRHNPLYQALFSFHDSPVPELSLPGVEVEVVAALSNGSAKFDLNVVAIPRAEQRAGQGRGEEDDGVTLVWEYDGDLFDAATIETMVGQFRAVLEAAAADPETPVSRLPAQRPAARPAETAPETVEVPSTTLHRLFEEQARRTPGAVAIIHDTASLTCAELDERANRLAQRLRRLGAGPEVRVGVCLERTPELVVALLAVLKAGAAYVPLDPAYPAERLRLTLADAASPLLVTQESLRGLLPARDGVAVVSIDRDAAEIAAESAEGPGVEVSPRNLAYLIYTSGSTGVPKGVAIEHDSAVAMLAWAWEIYGAEELGGMLGSTSICFDMSVFEIFAPLSRGGRVILVDNALALPRSSAADQVRLVDTVPSAIAELLRTGGIPAGVRTVNLGGEPLHAELVDALYAAGVERVYDLYGPSEDTTFSTFALRRAGGPVTIGRPIANTRDHLLDPGLEPVADGAEGELYLGGRGITRGYLGRPALTAERYLPDPFAAHPGARMYRTGDRVRRRPDGTLEYLGRLDHQVKIRGFRVETGEVEAVLRRCPGVRECVVVAREDEPGEMRLVAYATGTAPAEEMRSHLRQALPEYMVPGAFVALDALPLTPNGKVDRRALPAPAHAEAPSSAAPRSELEARVAEAWCRVLRVPAVGVHDNFFDVGGTSLMLARVHADLRELSPAVRMVDLFRHTTVEALAGHLALLPAAAAPPPAAETASSPPSQAPPRPARRRPRRGVRPLGLRAGRRGAPRGGEAHLADAIAVVGMSCRVPGARDTAELWRKLCDGVESISFFSDDQLLAAGVSPDDVRDAAYIRAYGVLEDAYAFDAGFFRVTARETQLMDPQQRVFLECAWSALEDAGVDPARYAGAIGVYAGSRHSLHPERVRSDPELAALPPRLALLGSAADLLTTRVSYKLGLRGPSVAVQTGCSTSLVAIHVACRSLLGGECDMALAGGVNVPSDEVQGYRTQEGSFQSSDGHCRAFDARAAGTVGGSGVGVVVLKRLADAVRDGDPIRAIVRGSAINNDGAGKIGFSAPSVEGQARVVSAALRAAGVEPGSIGYVEAHGTGTPLGDPIEAAALTEAFRGVPRRRVALGAAKTNFGHLDIAAGVAGFIKTVLTLQHGAIPPTLHFERANPETGLDESPFYVNTVLRPWPRNGVPRRAGVSSLGIGGTNAHAVLEEAPPSPAPTPVDGPELLVLSARSEAALERMRRRLADHLAGEEDVSLADAAFTLQEGRAALPHRWAAAVSTVDEARAALAGTHARKPAARRAADRPPSVAFLFPGQGTMYPGAAAELYAREPVFREEIGRCAAALADELGVDLRDVLFPAAGREAEAAAPGSPRRIALPALFAVQYATARLWMHRGVRPDAVIGHSVGEYAAACLAGVFTRDDALRLVAARGRLLDTLPAGGAMLAVPLGEDEVAALLSPRLALAAVNGPASCVVSGDGADVDALAAALAGRGVEARRLHVAHAMHSPAMDPILEAFGAEVRRTRRSAPSIPLASSLTGDWMTAEQAADPGYWVRHLRETVRFSDGVGRVMEDPARVLLEVGPGETLGTFARRRAGGAGRVIVRSLAPAARPEPADLTMLDAAGALWSAGVEIDWTAVRGPVRRRRVALPTYPFEREQYPVPPAVPPAAPVAPVPAPAPATARELAPASAAVSGGGAPGGAHAAPPAPAPEAGSTVRDRVAALFAALLGIEPGALDPDATFLELGTDSLVLMQASRNVESAFGVRIPFRELLTSYSTVRTVAAHLEREAPAATEPALAASPARPDAPVAASAVRAAPAAQPWSNGAAAPPDAATEKAVLLQAHAAAMQAQAAAMQAHAAILELFRGTPAAPAGPAPTAPPEDHDPSGASSDFGRIAVADGADREPSATAIEPASSSTEIPASAAEVKCLPLPSITPSPLHPFTPSRPFPLTPAQQQIWTHAQLGDDASRTYNLPIAFAMRGPLDLGALDAALQDLAAHHEALRTVFDASGETQQVLASITVPLAVRELPEAREGEDALAAALAEALRGVFDLRAGPLIRAQVYVRGPEHHVIQLVLHHLAADGIALGILERDLAAAYGARRDGRAPRLAPAMQFSEYARLAAAQGGDDPAWRSPLEGAVPLALPYDRPRPAVPAHRAAHATRTLAPALTAAMAGLARGEGCTPFTALLAGLMVVLHRLSGQDDLVVGVPAAGRPFPGAEGVVGDCATVLPVRGRMRGGASVREYLRQVRDALLDAQAHEMSAARPAPGLISVAANLRSRRAGGGTTFAGLEREPLDVPMAHTVMDLHLSAVENDGALQLWCTYDADLFDAATIDRLLARVERVIEQAAADPDGRVDRVEIVDRAERDALLAWGTGAEVDAAAPTLCALFDRQAERTPDAPALVAGSERLTFAALRGRADRLAARLRAAGTGRGTVVGVCTGRTAEMVVGLLGVLKSGGVHLPLDPAYPAERLSYMLDDSGAPVIVTTSALATRLPAGPARVLIDADDGAPLPAVRDQVWAEDAAYLVYTSGSTGTPKGVVVRHGEAARHCAAAVAAFGLTADDTVLHFASASFDVSLEQLLPPLSVGARVVLRGDEVPSPAAMAALLRGEGITVANPPTGYWHPLVDDAASRAALRQARLVIAGGDVMRPDAVRAWEQAEGPARLLNAYGPTETLITAAAYEVPAGFGGERVPIGRPFPGRRLYVAREAGELLPAGVAGELCIGGPLLAHGYLGRPAATAERFVPDPFAGVAGARMYRTGDRVKVRTHALEFLGRLDAQVKIRGFRVEPGEVESALRAHPAVRDAAAAVRDDGTGTAVLAGWVVPREGASVNVGELRAFVAARLPAHAVPDAIATLDALPLTPNGKVDRAALPDPGTAPAAGYEAPRGETEAVLAELWADVLGLPRAGRGDDFFALRGHSLLAIRLVARVRDLLGADLPVRALFDAPTPAALAERVEAARRAGTEPVPPLEPRGQAEPAPLTFAQRRLWFLDRMEPGRASYNLPAVVRLRGTVDAAALERAVAALAARHAALRTVFRAADSGEPRQVVLDGAGFRVVHTDVSHLGERAEAEALRAVEADARRPFHLADGPLFRALLVRVAADDHLLALTLHHAVGDGASLRVLFRELSALYAAFARGGADPLPAPRLQYADHAAWQRAWLTDERLAPQVAWWSQALAGAPSALTLPTDRPRPAAQSYRGAVHRFELGADAGESLRALGRHAGATPFMTLLAAFAAVLARWSGQDDVVVGTPVDGRAQRGTEEMVGLFVNTLPVRVGLGGDPDFRALLGRVREAVLGTLAHQDVPFERLVEELRPERSLSRQPIYQVTFAMDHDAPTDALSLDGVRAARVPVDGGSSKFDLMLAVAEHEDGLRAVIEYATDLFDAASMERLASHLRTLLAAAAANPGAALSTLPLIDADERARLIAAGAAVAPVQPVATLHARFAAQAARTPGAVAVTCEGQSLRYGELEARANRLARHLQSLGVGPETRVGLCVERSMEMVVAILGVLKAGGAYVPLDPAYPAERLAYVLEDAGIGIVLTQAHLADALPATGARAVRLDADWPSIGALPADAPASRAAPGNTAYVIYTSGSTGKPKGCAVTHANATRLFSSTEAWFGFGETDVWTLFHSYAFDFSVWEIWGALLYGGRLVVVPFPVSRDPAAFLALLAAERVTVLNQTPSAFRQLAAADEDAAARGEAPRLALRFVVFGGEALEPASLRGWVARRGDERPRLVNMYGITETTVHVTWRPITRAEVEGGAQSVIGIPLPDLSVHLLDPRGEPVPVGVPGEIHVGGAGVSLGYPGRPALTAQRFVPDPFSGVPGARLYRAGDLARWTEVRECESAKVRKWGVDEDSAEDAPTLALSHSRTHALEYLGRIDDQVKLRGFRVEPAEIEAALAAHPGVARAAVAVQGAGADLRLLAFFVPAAGAAPAAAEVREFLRARLPGHMVPAGVQAVDSFPLTPNGKLDRRALAAAWSGPEAGAVAPRGEVEEALAELFGEVLGVDGVGAHDGFFELGGHSLLAIRAAGRLTETFRMEVPVRLVFEAPTVAAMAAALEAREPRPGQVKAVARVLSRLRAMDTGQVRAALRGPAKEG
jgi:amino acid adenylation domain-containing protein